MTATAEPKTRAPRAIAVAKLVDGKLVTELGRPSLELLVKAGCLCADLFTIPAWEAEAREAADKIKDLLAKVKGQ
jgi:hypothetical protein